MIYLLWKSCPFACWQLWMICFPNKEHLCFQSNLGVSPRSWEVSLFWKWCSSQQYKSGKCTNPAIVPSLFLLLLLFIIIERRYLTVGSSASYSECFLFESRAWKRVQLETRYTQEFVIFLRPILGQQYSKIDHNHFLPSPFQLRFRNHAAEKWD
jgi:hypothetical protein